MDRHMNVWMDILMNVIGQMDDERSVRSKSKLLNSRNKKHEIFTRNIQV